MARSLAARVHDMARNSALRKLKELHEDEYDGLFEEARLRIEAELQYSDQRPEANRRRHGRKSNA